jgi:hypothetical protein
MPAGFTIRVTAPPGSGGASIQEYFDVAIGDENRAKEAVRIAATLASDAIVEVVGELRLVDIWKAGLHPEEVLSVRKAIAGSERQARGLRRRY